MHGQEKEDLEKRFMNITYKHYVRIKIMSFFKSKNQTIKIQFEMNLNLSEHNTLGFKEIMYVGEREFIIGVEWEEEEWGQRTSNALVSLIIT